MVERAALTAAQEALVAAAAVAKGGEAAEVAAMAGRVEAGADLEGWETGEAERVGAATAEALGASLGVASQAVPTEAARGEAELEVGGAALSGLIAVRDLPRCREIYVAQPPARQGSGRCERLRV